MAERFHNLVELYQRSCTRYADRPLYGSKKAGAWVWTSYGQVADEVDRCRAGLVRLGVGKGDRVAIVADNCVEWAVAAYATYGLEAAFVPMYQAQRSDERRYILADCGAKVAIVANDAIRRDVAAMALPELLHIVVLDRPADDPSSWTALLATGAAAPARAGSPEPDSVADFIYTSGTTGKPKGVLLSHANIASNVSAIHEIFTFEPDDRSLSFLPWAHAYGQISEVHGLISMGCSVALNDDLANLLSNLVEVKPTILFAVPRIFNRIYEGVTKELAQRPAVVQRAVRAGINGAIKRAHGGKLGPLERVELAFDEKLVFAKIRERFGGRLKYAISGSATLGREVAEFVDALGLTVYEAYGLTETSPIVSANLPGCRRLGSVGHIIPGVRVVIDHTVAGADAAQGEIIVHGPNVMLGYHHQPEENAKVLMKDGGLRTGDLGYLDSDGFLYITGRIKEQYKLENGRYVMPSVLEEELKLSPYVANVMIYGDGKPFNVALVAIDDARIREWAKGEALTVGEDLTRDEHVRALLRDEIALHAKNFKPFERPLDFAIVAHDFTTQDGLLTPTLKLRRREVMARYGARIEGLYAKHVAAEAVAS
jgi:long-chain acyl-CoA synthetase